MTSSLQTAVKNDHDKTNRNITNSDNNHFILQNISSIDSLANKRKQYNLPRSISISLVNSNSAIKQNNMEINPKMSTSTPNTLVSSDRNYNTLDDRSKSLVISNPNRSTKEFWVHPDKTILGKKYIHDSNLTRLKLKLNNTIIHISNQQKKLANHGHSLPPTCTQTNYGQPKSNLKLSRDIIFSNCIYDICKDSNQTGWQQNLRTKSNGMNNTSIISYIHNSNFSEKYCYKHNLHPHANSVFRNFITRDAIDILKNLKLIFPNNYIFSKISDDSLQVRLYDQKATTSDTDFFPCVSTITFQDQFNLFDANSSSHHFKMTKHYEHWNRTTSSKNINANTLKDSNNGPEKTGSICSTNTDRSIRNYRPYSSNMEKRRLWALYKVKKYNDRYMQHSVQPTVITTPNGNISQIPSYNIGSAQTKIKFKIVSAQTKIKLKSFKSYNKILDSRGFSEEEDNTDNQSLTPSSN